MENMQATLFDIHASSLFGHSNNKEFLIGKSQDIQVFPKYLKVAKSCQQNLCFSDEDDRLNSTERWDICHCLKLLSSY